jgi:hypothetical protein
MLVIPPSLPVTPFSVRYGPTIQALNAIYTEPGLDNFFKTLEATSKF